MDIELGSRFRLFQPGRKTLSPSYFLCVFWDESNGMTRPCIAQTIGDTLGPIVLELTEMGSPNYEDAEVELYAGDWQLTVYEQTSSTNYDPALSGREVWSELVRVNVPATPPAPREPYDGPIVPDENRVCLVPCVYGTPTDGQVIGWNASEVRSEWQTAGGGGGSGDVTGPSSAANNNFASYNGTTGKIIKDSGSNAASFDAAGAASAAQAAAIAAAASDATTKANAALNAAISASDPVGSAAAAQAAAIAASAQRASNLSDLANASTARTNLGLEIGTNVQAQSATLSALANMGVPVSLGGIVALTNQSNALAFLSAVVVGPRLDLTGFTEVKFQIGVITGSASANTPKVILRYFTSYSTTTTDYLNIGTSEVSCSLTTAGIIETAWIPLAAGAIGANKFLRMLMSGGDGAADPVVSIASAFFR